MVTVSTRAPKLGTLFRAFSTKKQADQSMSTKRDQCSHPNNKQQKEKEHDTKPSYENSRCLQKMAPDHVHTRLTYLILFI